MKRRSALVRLFIAACCFFCVEITSLVAIESKEAPILILGAVPQEVPYIVERLEGMVEGELRGFRYWRGRLGEQEVVVSLTSVGKAYTSMCTALFIEKFEPKAAFMCGTGSRTNPEKRTGDIVIPKELFFHDYGSLTETDIDWSDMYQPGTRIPLSRILPVTPEMRSIAESLLRDYTPHEVTVDGLTYPVTIDLDSIVATADLFGVREARIKKLRAALVDLMEMESAAFALTCMQMEIPYIVVRAGSNLSQPTPSKDYLIYGPIAARSAAQVTHYLVSNWPNEEI